MVTRLKLHPAEEIVGQLEIRVQPQAQKETAALGAGRAAIAVADNPPEDQDLARFADLLIDASFGWARFNGSRLRLATAVRAYTLAASLADADI